MRQIICKSFYLNLSSQTHKYACKLFNANPNLSVISSKSYSKKTNIEDAVKKGKTLLSKTLKELKKTPIAHQLRNVNSLNINKRKITFTTLFSALMVSFFAAVYGLGKPPVDNEGMVRKDRFSNLPLPIEYFFRFLHELQYYVTIFTSNSSEKLLPDQRKYGERKKYTLILEFTDVLVHPKYNQARGWSFKKRPGIDYFLESVGTCYEIVLYTAEPAVTVFPIIKAMDPKNIISYKLVKNSTLLLDGQRLKDLDNINRNLSRVIVVDWDSNCTKCHPDNVLVIPRWFGNDDDMSLIYLSQFLLAIADNEIEDVREVVKYYNKFEDPLRAFREKQTKLVEIAEANANKQMDKSKLWL